MHAHAHIHVCTHMHPHRHTHTYIVLLFSTLFRAVAKLAEKHKISHIEEGRQSIRILCDAIFCEQVLGQYKDTSFPLCNCPHVVFENEEGFDACSLTHDSLQSAFQQILNPTNG